MRKTTRGNGLESSLILVKRICIRYGSLCKAHRLFLIGDGDKRG